MTTTNPQTVPVLIDLPHTSWDEEDESIQGVGEKRSVGYNVNGTVTHFEKESGLQALCGVRIDMDSDSDNWVSCHRCMGIARKAAEGRTP